MTIDDFSRQLRDEGYTETVTVEREANARLDRHSHPFASKALVLDGEIQLVVDGRETTYRAGDIFQLEHGQPHVERYGPAGVRYLVGRK
jgi:quercetin dioxygenase-like cupin family protein